MLFYIARDSDNTLNLFFEHPELVDASMDDSESEITYDASYWQILDGNFDFIMKLHSTMFPQILPNEIGIYDVKSFDELMYIGRYKPNCN